MARKQKDNIVRLSDFDEPLNTNGNDSGYASEQKKSRLYSTNQSQNNNNDNNNNNGETEEGGENTKSNKGRPKEKKPASKKKKAAIIVASLAVLGGAGFGGYTYYKNKLEIEQYNQKHQTKSIERMLLLLSPTIKFQKSSSQDSHLTLIDNKLRLYL